MVRLNPKNLNIFLENVSKIVDPKIKEVLALSIDKKNQELVKYQIRVGGKRLRPALTILSCLVCGGKINKVLSAAAGLEILHNYTLIVDDIIDNSNLRRGRPTTWFKFGKSIAQCVGMAYIVAVFQAANRSKKSIEVSELFAQTVKEIFEGEMLDILFEQSGREEEKYVTENRYKKITLPNYFEMVSKKTASLMQICCQVGGVIAGADQSKMTALTNYGFNLGKAFQIRDDILDIFGQRKEFGKKIGKDIKERKLGNIVVLYALKELPQIKKKKVLNTFKKKEIKEKDIKEVVKLIKQTRAQEKASLLGEKYIQKAKENLKLLPRNKWNEILSEFADFIIERNK